MIQIIDYGAGNLKSVTNALEKLGQNYQIIKSPMQILPSARVIFPGVGAAGSAMEKLNESEFTMAILNMKNLFLGICLGMQLLTKFSEENETACIGVIDGQTKKFPDSVKAPQIGWNTAKQLAKNPLFEDIPDNSYFYFVNSYYVDSPKEFILGETAYGLNFSSVVKKNNFYGVQFHPEKSGEIGLRLLNNFCELC